MQIDTNDKFEEALNDFKRNIPEKLLIPTNINLLIRDAVFDYIVIFFSVLLYLNTVLFVKFILIIIIVSRLHSFGVIVHDLTHLSKNIRNIKVIVLEFLVGYPIGTSINAMRYHHLRHHKDNGMHTDPYFHHFENYKNNNFIVKFLNIMVGLFLIPSWILRSVFGGFCLFHENLQILYARIFLEHKGEISKKDLEEVIQCCRKDIVQAIYLSFLFFVIIKFAGISLFIQLYFIPILITGVISYYRTMKEHEYTRVYDRKLSTVINITNDHNTKGFLKFLLAPRNIGYHIAHHLHPQVGYRHLKKIKDYYLKHNKEIYK